MPLVTAEPITLFMHQKVINFKVGIFTSELFIIHTS